MDGGGVGWRLVRRDIFTQLSECNVMLSYGLVGVYLLLPALLQFSNKVCKKIRQQTQNDLFLNYALE